MQLLIRCCLLGFLLLATNIHATNYQNGQYQWNFLTGLPWPQGYNQSIGKPDNLIYARDEYSADFFQRISNALPESALNEAFITDDDGSTIHLNEEAEVFVTFIHEGAGYRNSFGYFVFDKNNPPQSADEVNEVIVFPNLSYPHMTNGHRVSLGTFPAGTSIGFFIAANGFWYYTGVKPFAVPYYYSLQGLNPEPIESLRQHTVLLYDEEVSEVIIGFEDLPRTWGDNDFNDAIFSVKSTPASAISSDDLTTMPNADDSDADGVPDSQDEFPNNHRRTYSSYYPSESGYVTLAYEDNWPKLGDFDFNDLVVKEQFRTTYDAEGNISGMIINGYIMARGAANKNGFAMRLMNIPPGAVEQASIEIDGETFSKSVEGYQTDAVIQFWSNSKLFTSTGQSGQCSHFNTLKNCSYYAPVPFTFDLTFTEDAGISNLPHSLLDFFIFRTNNRGIEIHLADYPPTDLFNQARFGKFADTSDASTGRYFRNANNLPWAIQLSSDWYYPREYIDILWAYPDYEAWVESSGTSHSDWQQTSNRTTHYYVPE